MTQHSPAALWRAHRRSTTLSEYGLVQPPQGDSAVSPGLQPTLSARSEDMTDNQTWREHKKEHQNNSRSRVESCTYLHPDPTHTDAQKARCVVSHGSASTNCLFYQSSHWNVLVATRSGPYPAPPAWRIGKYLTDQTPPDFCTHTGVKVELCEGVTYQ